MNFQSLTLLSANPLNVKKLKTGALLAILSELSDHDDCNINQQASVVMDNLTDCVNEDASAMQAITAPSAAAAVPPPKKAATYLHTIPMAIPTICNSAQQGLLIEKLLVKQTGVVSCSIDILHNRCTIYSSLFNSAQCAPLLAVLETAGFPATIEGAAPLGGKAAVGKENSGYLNADQFANASTGPRKGSLAMAGI